MLDLADFDYRLIHVPGSKLNAPDALSQGPNLIPKVDDDNEGVAVYLCQSHRHQTQQEDCRIF